MKTKLPKGSVRTHQNIKRLKIYLSKYDDRRDDT
jgi:hypothetical protein